MAQDNKSLRDVGQFAVDTFDETVRNSSLTPVEPRARFILTDPAVLDDYSREFLHTLLAKHPEWSTYAQFVPASNDAPTALWIEIPSPSRIESLWILGSVLKLLLP
jgi:hypothetical protein